MKNFKHIKSVSITTDLFHNIDEVEDYCARLREKFFYPAIPTSRLIVYILAEAAKNNFLLGEK